MPLDKSGSKASVGTNILAERAAGKPKKQALAIALATQDRAKSGPKQVATHGKTTVAYPPSKAAPTITRSKR